MWGVLITKNYIYTQNKWKYAGGVPDNWTGKNLQIAVIAATVESTKQILLIKTYLNDEKNMSVHGKHDICWVSILILDCQYTVYHENNITLICLHDKKPVC